MKEFFKMCPRCGEKQIYGCKSSLIVAIKKNRICIKCLGKLKRKHNGIFERICKCGNIMKYTCRQGLNLAKKHNALCRSCASKKSASLIDRSFQKTEEYREKMSISCKGKTHNEKTKEKLRIAKLKQIKEKGTKINYNPKACEFIDNFGKENKFNFRHALNGGEVSFFGYSLDGYDKEKNIIFEYDEPKHNIKSIKKRDIKRQNILIERLNPLHFFRYDEEKQNLYDVILERNG
jgi:hypothetical protein